LNWAAAAEAGAEQQTFVVVDGARESRGLALVSGWTPSRTWPSCCPCGRAVDPGAPAPRMERPLL
jgi:hypothetical protein